MTDFDFYIDIGQCIAHGPVHWSIADSEPAFRGLMVRQIDAQPRRNASRREKKTFDSWKKQRTAKGLPPWVASDTWLAGGTDALKSSRTLRQWADDYCASPKHLKEFVYEKVGPFPSPLSLLTPSPQVIHGWNIDHLTEAVRATISDSLYQGDVKIDFELSADKIYIRPDNTLSRMLSNKWIFVLSIVLLIYPFIWLFKRFHSRGGGRWEVCGGAYALKHYGPALSTPPPKSPFQHPETSDGQGSSHSSAATALAPRLIETPDGVHQLTGLREGEWFKQWEATIWRAVQNRYISTTPMYRPHVVVSPAALRLDGYDPV